MTATPARRAALATLRAVRRRELADRALDDVLRRLPARDRPWTHELVYGTLRLRGRLDHMLGQLVHQPLAALEPDVLDALRLGAYQLVEMGSVPAYAAVSQSVELVKPTSGAGAGRLVNGVLQSLRRRRDSLTFPSFEDDPLAYLETWGSHPRWLLERWSERFGMDQTRRLVDANNTRPELYLRPVGVTADSARAQLGAAGIRAEPVPDVTGSLHVTTENASPQRGEDGRGAGAAAPSPSGRTVQPLLSIVPSVIQDPAATLVVTAATPASASARVADLTAAPGGKALALAGGTGQTSPYYVFAGDVSYARALRLRENARRIGRLPIGIVVADARRPPLREADHDVVLVDAPCTGTGTLRRHPDGRWRLEPDDLRALIPLQRELLRAAAALVRPGGALVYATCSLEPEENEEQVQEFLADESGFVAEPVTNVNPHFIDEHGQLRVLPQRTGFDGAFAARMRRR